MVHCLASHGFFIELCHFSTFVTHSFTQNSGNSLPCQLWLILLLYLDDFSKSPCPSLAWTSGKVRSHTFVNGSPSILRLFRWNLHHPTGIFTEMIFKPLLWNKPFSKKPVFQKTGFSEKPVCRNRFVWNPGFLYATENFVLNSEGLIKKDLKLTEIQGPKWAVGMGEILEKILSLFGCGKNITPRDSIVSKFWRRIQASQ